MNRLIDRYWRLLNGLMAVLLAVMVVLVFGNVVLRYVFNSGITASEELSRWAFVWVTFLGAIVALKDKAHLGTDIVVSTLPRFAQLACLIVSRVLMLVLCGWVLHGSWQQLRINWDVQAPVTGLSMGWFYAPGVIFSACGLVLLVLELLDALRQSIAKLQTAQESQAVSAPEGTDHARQSCNADGTPDAPVCRNGARR